jgi:hypothetical protein
LEVEVMSEHIGTGWSFPPRFVKNGNIGVEMVSGEIDIEESMSIILSTDLEERFIHPDFGADLREYSFKSLDTATTLEIKRKVANSIKEYEPRVTLNGIFIDSSRLNEGIFTLDIKYTVNATGNKKSLVYPFYLEM